MSLDLRKLSLSLIPFSIVACLTACKSSTNSRVNESEVPARTDAAPRILQFYAAPGVIPRGETSSLCYGVENAETVSIDPPVEEIKPALSRCLSVSPSSSTRYTLTARSSGGETSKTIELTIGKAPPPLSGGGPQVLAFSSDLSSIKPGQTAMLCFQVEGGDPKVDPPVQQLGSVRQGCFAVSPKQTTIYTLSTGRDSRKVTVRVE